jgi:hypothetical protein
MLQFSTVVTSIGASTHSNSDVNLPRNFSTANYVISRLVMYLAPDTTERMRGFLVRLYRKLQLIPDDYPR